MKRYEVPAMILVDADTEPEARAVADRLTFSLIREDGPGAFFTGVGVLATGERARPSGDDRQEEPIEQHVASLVRARGN